MSPSRRTRRVLEPQISVTNRTANAFLGPRRTFQSRPTSSSALPAEPQVSPPMASDQEGQHTTLQFSVEESPSSHNQSTPLTTSRPSLQEPTPYGLPSISLVNSRDTPTSISPSCRPPSLSAAELCSAATVQTAQVHPVPPLSGTGTLQKLPSFQALRATIAAPLPSPTPTDEPSPAATGVHESPGPAHTRMDRPATVTPLGPASAVTLVAHASPDSIGMAQYTRSSFGVQGGDSATTTPLSTSTLLPSRNLVSPAIPEAGHAFNREIFQEPMQQTPHETYAGTQENPLTSAQGPHQIRPQEDMFDLSRLHNTLGRRLDNVLPALTRNSESSTSRRYMILRDAVQQGDRFFLVLHQVFCLWAINRRAALALLQALDDSSHMEGGLGLVGETLGGNDCASLDHMNWFARFPIQDYSLYNITPAASGLRNHVGNFLLHLSFHWRTMLQKVQQRGYPIFVSELKQNLKLESPLLLGTMFTMSCERLGVLGGNIAAVMQERFQADRHMTLTAQSPAEKDAFQSNLRQVYRYLVRAYNQQVAATQQQDDQQQRVAADMGWPQRAHQTPIQQSAQQQPNGFHAQSPIQSQGMCPARGMQGVPAMQSSHRPAPPSAFLPSQQSQYVYSQGQPVWQNHQAPNLQATLPPGGIPRPRLSQQPVHLSVNGPSNATTSLMSLHMLNNPQMGFNQVPVEQRAFVRQLQSQPASQMQPRMFSEQALNCEASPRPRQGRMESATTAATALNSTTTTATASGSVVASRGSDCISTSSPDVATTNTFSNSLRPMPNITSDRTRTGRSFQASLAAQATSSAAGTMSGLPYAHANGGYGGAPNQQQPQVLQQQQGGSAPRDRTLASGGGSHHGSRNLFMPPASQVIRLDRHPQSPHDARSTEMSLHLVDARSPRRIPAQLPSASNPGSGRFYQAVKCFAAEPIVIETSAPYALISFDISHNDFTTKLSKYILPNGETLPVCSYFDGSLRYRLRMCEMPADRTTPISETDWVTTPTFWPEHVFVSINSRAVKIRRKTHHGQGQPAELTEFLRPGKNEVTVSVLAPFRVQRAMKLVAVVEVIETLGLSSLKKLVQEEGMLSADVTPRVIKRRLESPGDEEDLFVTDNTLSVDVTEPFAKRLFTIPARGSNCTHLECFDLDIFLETRAAKKGCPHNNRQLCNTCRRFDNLGPEPSLVDQWKCPICDKDARPYNLQIDMFLQKVRNLLVFEGRHNTKSISVKVDGSWVAKVEEDDDDIDIDEPEPKRRKSEGPFKQRGCRPDPVVIELD